MTRKAIGGRATAPGERWITVRVPESAYAQLQRIADNQERSVSWIVRKMVLGVLACEDTTPMAPHGQELT